MAEDSSLFAGGYRHFLAVAEKGSVRAAARHMGLAPSAVSRQLAALEAGLGVSLLERVGNVMRLTEAGQLLQSGLAQSRMGHQLVLEQIDAVKGLRRGRLRVATVESVAADLLPAMLDDFMKHHPGVEVSAKVTDAREVTALLLAHEADVGFTFNPRERNTLGIAYERAMPVGAVMAPRHPLAKAKDLTLAQCFAHAVAWPAQGLSLRAVLDQGVQRARLSVSPAFECNSLRLMTALAKSGRCLSFQTEIGIGRELKDKSLVFRPLAKDRLPEDRLVVLMRPGLAGHPAVERFMALAKSLLP